MRLPSYKGSTFRGGILTAFKKTVCVMPHGQCEICPLTDSCSYYFLFEPHRLATGRGVPMPYVLKPPLTEARVFEAGDLLNFSVNLVGKATVYWKLLIFSLKRLGETSGIGQGVNGRRGKYIVKQVDTVTREGHLIPVYSDSRHFHPVDMPPLNGQPVTVTAEQFRLAGDETASTDSAIVRFLTPLRLIKSTPENKTLVKHLEFPDFMRELFRRLSDLSEAFCEGNRLNWENFRDVIEAVQTKKRVLYWKDWERYSNRKRARMKLGGLIGTLKLEGELAPLLPYLRLGEWLHVGKQSTFGLGHYQINLSN